MTRLLLRLTVKENKNFKDPSVRCSLGRLSGIVGILLNVILFAGKLTVGTLCGAISVTADALNNLTDASSSLMSLVGFRLASLPADRNHPYGHARMEYITGFTMSIVILFIGAELAKTSLDQILSPSPVEFSQALGWVMAGSILVKLWLAYFNRTLGRLTNSAALRAVAADSWGDVLATSAVLIASLVQAHTGWAIDGPAGMCVSLLIFRSGIEIFKDTVTLLLGSGPDPQLVKEISHVLLTPEEVIGFHDLMVHDYGPGRRFATAHVEMDSKLDPLICHDTIDSLERQCNHQFGLQMCIHYDPVVTDDPQLNDAKELVSQCVACLDSRLSIHDLRMVKGASSTKLIFDLVVPFEFSMSCSQLQEEIERAVKVTHPDYYTVITFDTDAFNSSQQS